MSASPPESEPEGGPITPDASKQADPSRLTASIAQEKRHSPAVVICRAVKPNQ